MYYRTGNEHDAEDLTARVFIRAMNHIPAYKQRGLPFSAWLYRIAHNLVVDYFRKKGSRPTAPLDAAANKIGASSSDLEYQASISLTMSEVTVAMDVLTDLQREVIALRFASGLSIAETAETIGTSALQASQQFTRLWPSVLVVIGYALAFYLLEPESDDGLANWNFLEEYLEGGRYPIYKVMGELRVASRILR